MFPVRKMPTSVVVGNCPSNLQILISALIEGMLIVDSLQENRNFSWINHCVDEAEASQLSS